jgi:hypothetical protein
MPYIEVSDDMVSPTRGYMLPTPPDPEKASPEIAELAILAHTIRDALDKFGETGLGGDWENTLYMSLHLALQLIEEQPPATVASAGLIALYGRDLMTVINQTAITQRA